MVQPKEELLLHFVAALAYRTQKALRGAPPDFGDFEAGNMVRTPKQLLRHMTSVLGYARAFYRGGTYRPEPLDTLDQEVERFHAMLGDLSDHLEAGHPLRDTPPERVLQGPLADALTHAGQLAMLRRLHGSPVPPENFFAADIRVKNVSQIQPEAREAASDWPERL